MLITLTDKAIAKVKELGAKQAPPVTCIRVGVQGGGCSGLGYFMRFESMEREGDTAFEFDGIKVFVDQTSAMYLDGVEIDYTEQLDGSGFKFNNPNVHAQCGCGKSFTV